MLLIFGFYVRSVPPKVRQQPRVVKQQQQQGVPEFMNIQVDKDPNVVLGDDAERAALDEAMRLLKERDAAAAAAANPEDGDKGDEPASDSDSSSSSAAAAEEKDVLL